ncbi:MAG: alpha-1,4-glucan--maltose-1-phosphate maltosyltransferase [bacterium]
MNDKGKKRVIIEHVKPEIDTGKYPIKRVTGEKVIVQADIFTDGHDKIAAELLYRSSDTKQWKRVPMQYLVNDRWEAEFQVETVGVYYYTITVWVDHFATWQDDLQKKFQAGQDISVDLRIGTEEVKKVKKRVSPADKKKLNGWVDTINKADSTAQAVAVALDAAVSDIIRNYPDKNLLCTYDKELEISVNRPTAQFSVWYEMFPRSTSQKPEQHGTFKDCERLLPELKEMGFNVIYFPPIHPIGETHRKGKNNTPQAEAGDPGSPWAIGSKEGGHKSIHPELGNVEDFTRLVKKIQNFGMEIALDLAFQCSPDHPYVTEHPEWFRWRPDGTVQYAENPPKKYEDILPIYFETENWKELWEELKSIVLFWIEKGVKIFRVDNPHTKPFVFWEWLISDIKKDYPDVIFLSEAFTRPKVMYKLAKIGFTQSYTYFTWRNTKYNLTEYLKELTQSEVREYFRPNFWPNTPDILPEFLQYGGKPAFIIRLVLAATLSSNYGIYGPAFELCINDAVSGKEEYLNSEKYEIKHWDRSSPESIKNVITRVNRIRQENKAFHMTSNLTFYTIDNDTILAYQKASEDLSNIMLVVVNLDPFHIQSGFVQVPVDSLGIPDKDSYLVHDLLSDKKYIWQGEYNYVELNPQQLPAHIFRIQKRLKKEQDFDYYV